ncbi:MAG: tRNA1(Val) (adenine(37)-N6)-methyltransferase [Fusobacteriota bacterium]
MKIIQRNDYQNFSLDSVLISNFLTINRKTKKVIDLGTGNGVIPMLLQERTKAQIEGIEIQEVSYNLAKKNITLNNLKNQVKIIKGDIKNYKNLFSHQSFDSAICNPPFFETSENEKQLNNLDQLSIARHEVNITLDEIVEAAAFLIKQRGYFSMVHRSKRLPEILEVLKKHNLEPKRLQFCHSKKDKKSKTVLIESMKNGKPGLDILPPLFTHKKDGTYSKKVSSMFS